MHLVSEPKQYIVIDNATNSEKTIEKNSFLEVEQAKYLNDTNSFFWGDIYAATDNVYIIGYTNGCAIIFKYNLETNRVKYYSWIDTSRLIQEPRNFYFFILKLAIVYFVKNAFGAMVTKHLTNDRH